MRSPRPSTTRCCSTASWSVSITRGFRTSSGCARGCVPEAGGAVTAARVTAPATLIVFDVLHLAGRSTRRLPYRERRPLLESLALEGPAWRTPRTFAVDEDLVAVTRDRHLEGVVAKRLNAPYQPGRRSEAWRKHKHRHRERLTITAWRPGDRREPDEFLVSRRGDGGQLRYAGGVRFGLSTTERARLRSLLGRIERPRATRSRVRRVQPVLAVDVDYHGRPGGPLRDAVLATSRSQPRSPLRTPNPSQRPTALPPAAGPDPEQGAPSGGPGRPKPRTSCSCVNPTWPPELAALLRRCEARNTAAFGRESRHRPRAVRDERKSSIAQALKVDGTCTRAGGSFVRTAAISCDASELHGKPVEPDRHHPGVGDDPTSLGVALLAQHLSSRGS